jgi:allantoate deiminase
MSNTGVLENAGQAVAALSAICGTSRFSVTVEDTAGHAGKVAMARRQDAPVTAERASARVSDLAAMRDVWATVRPLNFKRGTMNASPFEVLFTP